MNKFFQVGMWENGFNFENDSEMSETNWTTFLTCGLKKRLESNTTPGFLAVCLMLEVNGPRVSSIRKMWVRITEDNDFRFRVIGLEKMSCHHTFNIIQTVKNSSYAYLITRSQQKLYLCHLHCNGKINCGNEWCYQVGAYKRIKLGLKSNLVVPHR